MLEQIEIDLKTALLAGDSLKVEVLKRLKNSLNNLKIEQKHALSDNQAVRVVQREIKKCIEAAEIYSSADASERAQKERNEALILETYLPRQLSEEELETIIDKIVSENGASSPQEMGKVMGLVNKEIGARASGATIAKIVKQKLGV